jgi:Uma2 family endonuclease
LSLISPDNLQQVDIYLQNLTKKIQQKEQRRARILSLAGGWNDMTESEFQDFLSIAKA